MTSTNTLIQSALAAPTTHCVITAYADGSVRRHETRSAASAETFAIGERRKIGRPLINRDTGRPVEVVSVTVSAL